MRNKRLWRCSHQCGSCAILGIDSWFFFVFFFSGVRVRVARETADAYRSSIIHKMGIFFRSVVELFVRV